MRVGFWVWVALGKSWHGSGFTGRHVTDSLNIDAHLIICCRPCLKCVVAEKETHLKQTHLRVCWNLFARCSFRNSSLFVPNFMQKCWWMCSFHQSKCTGAWNFADRLKITNKWLNKTSALSCWLLLLDVIHYHGETQ